MSSIDYSITSAIYGFSRNYFFDALAVFFDYFIYVLPVLLFIAFIFCRRKEPAVMSLVGAGFTFLISSAVKMVVQRPRPFHTGLLENLISASGYSFPSHHVGIAVCVAVVLSAYSSKNKILLYLTAFLISLSRIYAGVHYFSDVVFAMILGFVIGKVLITRKTRIYLWLKKKTNIKS